jgi:hypothetical protein
VCVTCARAFDMSNINGVCAAGQLTDDSHMPRWVEGRSAECGR